MQLLARWGISFDNEQQPFRTRKQRNATRFQEEVALAHSLTWRQIWRVAGRESGSPELLGSPGLPRKFPELPRKFFGDFPESSLTVELNSNPEVLRKFPKLPQTSPEVPGLPRRSAPFSGQPDTLSWLTKTFSDLQKHGMSHFRSIVCFDLNLPAANMRLQASILHVTWPSSLEAGCRCLQHWSGTDRTNWDNHKHKTTSFFGTEKSTQDSKVRC